MILGYCRFCHSSNTKISFAYPEDYFCIDCKKGGNLRTILSKEDLDKMILSKQIKRSQEIVKKNSQILKLESKNPCCEVFLDDGAEAVYPLDDQGVCDY